MKIKYLLYTLILGFIVTSANGQSLDDAKAWFLEGRYTEALPVFRTELQEKPNDASLNHWLGVSLYKTGNLIESEQYLTFASGRKVNDAYLYLGELYSKLYRFEDAEKEFEKYQRANRRNNEALERLEEARSYADRLRRSVNRTEDIQVIDSLVLPKKDFLAAYNLSNSSGSVMPINEFFNDYAISDKTLFINEREDKVYYSREDMENSSSLFTMDKLIDSFGNEKRLPDNISEGGSQAYPFVMSDGLTIYFASTGHNSFGGYDLYVTRYNLSSDSYLMPNQLNMPFNSPFNDYMMAIDEEKGVGWFASDRYQPSDSVLVYTFIPNSHVTLVENEDEGYKIERAKISSISETWKEGVDYNSLRALAQQKAEKIEQNKGDFEFVINDLATYHTLNDFRSGNARSVFSQVLGLEQQLESINNELSQKRDQYAAEGNLNSSLRASILELERQSGSLCREIERLKIQARNEEVRGFYN